MRWNTFAGSLVFAAAAAVGLVPVVLGLTPWVGVHTGLALYLVAITVLYLRGLVPEDQRRHAVVVTTLVIGLMAAASLRSVNDVALVLGIVLAIIRSAVTFRIRRARALVVETLLVGGGLLFARAVGGTTLIGWALALWAFLLVQSVYFLIGGVQTRHAREAELDGFAAAYGRAVALLERRDV